MFSTTVYAPEFPIEHALKGEQLLCYKARAQALAQRFPWSDAVKPAFKMYLVHRSLNVPGKVAYFQNVDNMMANRLTRTSPEMFLDRALRYAPPQVKAAWSVEVLGQVIPTLKLIPNTDPDGWERIYKTGPESCMQGSPLVRCYANPKNHLALAYMTNARGHVTYRTIVNTETKKYVRIYGDDDDDDVDYFVASLNQEGYRRDGEALLGETINVIDLKCNYCSNTVPTGPYLDGDYQLVSLTTPTEGVIGDEGDELCCSREYYCGCDAGRYHNDDDDEEE